LWLALKIGLRLGRLFAVPIEGRFALAGGGRPGPGGRRGRGAPRDRSLRGRRDRARRKSQLRVLRGEREEERDESDEFAASVQRDLSQLPTIDERDRR